MSTPKPTPFPRPEPTAAPGTPAAKPRKARKGMAITGLVLGLVALAGSPIPILNNATIAAGVVGIVFAAIGLFGAHKVMAGFGLVTAIAGIAIGIALQISWAHQLDDLNNKLQTDLKNIPSLSVPPPPSH